MIRLIAMARDADVAGRRERAHRRVLVAPRAAAAGVGGSARVSGLGGDGDGRMTSGTGRGGRVVFGVARPTRFLDRERDRCGMALHARARDVLCVKKAHRPYLRLVAAHDRGT